MANVNWNDYTVIDDRGPGVAAAAPAPAPAPAPAVDWSQFEPVTTEEPGFAATVKRTGGQMLTTAATSLEDVTGPNAVTRAADEAGQRIIDRNPAGIRSLRDLVDSPWLAVKEATGQFVPQIALAGAGAAAGARTGSAMGRLLGPVGSAAGGVVGGLLPIFTQEYGGIRQEQKEAGQEDKTRALAAAIPATALERVGMGKALNVLKGVPGGAAGTVLKEVGKGVLKEGATEGAQNVIEQIGAFKDPTKADNLEDTALAAAMGGIGGGVMGGASGAVDRVRARGQQSAGPAPADAAASEGPPADGAAVPGASGMAPATSETPAPATSGSLGGEQTGQPADASETSSNAPATPAINPADGPISKVASQAVELSLVPVAPASAAAPDGPTLLANAFERLTPEQQREARLLSAELERDDLPAGVRAFREGEAHDLASAAAPVAPGIEDMERGRVLRGFDARKADLPDVSSYADLIDSAVVPEYQEQVRQRLADAQNPALPPTRRAAAADYLHGLFSPEALLNARNTVSAPDQQLALQPVEQQRFGNEIEFDQPTAPTDPVGGLIAALAVTDGKTPGQPLRLNEAHSIRRRAIAAGVPATVIPHPSGRGYDVQPSVRLGAEQLNATPQAAPAALAYDGRPSGRMVAGSDGVRAETRAEGMQVINAERERRIALEEDRARRAALGLETHTRITPIALGQARSVPAGLPQPSNVIDGQTRVVPEGAGEVGRNNAEAAPGRENGGAVPATISMPDGRPFASREEAGAEQRRQGLADSHVVAPAQGDPSLGFLIRPRGSDDRAANWRTNALQASRVARDLGLNPRGKRLAQIVADIDASEAARDGDGRGSRGGRAGAAAQPNMSQRQVEDESSATFRRTTASGSGTFSSAARQQAVRSVTQTVDAIRAAWGGSADVVVAFDMNDPVVPESARRADLKQRSGGARGAPEGFYFRGKTYLMASRLATPQDTTRVLFHEVLGHHGLRGRFGKDLDSILNQVANMRKADVDAKIKEYGLRGVSKLDRRAAAEEVLANMAEKTPQLQFVRRAVAAIRTWLRQNVPGFKSLKLTDSEIIRSYILPAREWVIHGGATGGGGNALSFSRSGDQTISPVVLNVEGWSGGQAQLRELATNWYAANLQGKSFHNDDMNVDVGFSSEGKRAAFSTSGNLRMGWRAEMVKAMPELIKRAVKLGESSPDSRRVHDTKVFHTLVAPLSVNGKTLAAKITVREALLDPNGKPHKFYDIAALEIENGPVMSGVAPDVSTGPVHPTGTEPSEISVAELARAIKARGQAQVADAGEGGGPMFSREPGETPAAQRVDSMLKSVTVDNIKKQAGFKAADLRHLGLQMLGRRQLVDVYGEMLPELREYSNLMARMDADKNEAGAGADQLATQWGKLKDERALAELMHDATLAQMDPSREFKDGDNRMRYGELRRRYEALTPDAQGIFARARDTYRQHMRDVRNAIKDRIERAEMSSERKAEMLKRMDNEFFGHIKGVYFPLARFGQYLVVVKDADGKVANVSRAEGMAEADAMRSQLLTTFPAARGFSVGKVLKAKDFVADRDTVGRGFMEQLYGVLDKQGMDTKQRAELEDALGQLYLSSLPDLSWAKHGIHRKGTPGFSQDARRAFAQNVFHGASYLAKLRYGDQLQDHLAEMQRRVDASAHDESFDSVKGQQVVDEMVKRHDAAMNPKSSAVSTMLTSLGFIFHLGLSPASAMVNLTQTALVAYPVMGARWGFAKSSAALLKASQEAARGKNDITSALNPDERAAFDEAVRSGVVDVTMAHDLAGIAQGEDRNVSHKLAPVMRAASWMFHHAEKFNRQVTFIAAYRLAREAGADSKKAYADAVQATYDGHFDYSANNRPRFMQGNWQKVLLLFKQYSQNMVYTFARSAHQALKGASPEDRAVARKTLAGLLTTHAMAAGVLGLPMVTTLLAAASMLGGDDDEPWDAQVALQNLLADTFGQKPAEVLAHGLSRLTPWDISGRVGLDKLIFPDVQEGLEGQRLGESAMTAALGPVAAIGVNALKGLQEMSQGRYARGLETMAPTVLRGPLKALRYGTEGVKDKSGIVIQDEVDAAALLGQAAGFSPSEVRNAYEGKSAVVGHDKALMARRSALVERFAMAAMAKDEEGKAEARAAITKFNEKNPARRILPMQLAQSVHAREKRIREAQDGVYLPKKRRDVIEQGRFATGE